MSFFKKDPSADTFDQTGMQRRNDAIRIRIKAEEPFLRDGQFAPPNASSANYYLPEDFEIVRKQVMEFPTLLMEDNRGMVYFAGRNFVESMIFQYGQEAVDFLAQTQNNPDIQAKLKQFDGLPDGNGKPMPESESYLNTANRNVQTKLKAYNEREAENAAKEDKMLQSWLPKLKTEDQVPLSFYSLRRFGEQVPDAKELLQDIVEGPEEINLAHRFEAYVNSGVTRVLHIASPATYTEFHAKLEELGFEPNVQLDAVYKSVPVKTTGVIPKSTPPAAQLNL